MAFCSGPPRQICVDLLKLCLDKGSKVGSSAVGGGGRTTWMRGIWRFPEIGVPPIIHFNGIFSINHLFLGYPIYGNPHICTNGWFTRNSTDLNWAYSSSDTFLMSFDSWCHALVPQICLTWSSNLLELSREWDFFFLVIPFTHSLLSTSEAKGLEHASLVAQDNCTACFVQFGDGPARSGAKYRKEDLEIGLKTQKSGA